ncbi:MAG: restriction endonuclease subunit S [Syntrophales bacterium]|nr:restriction endonuclease subunit S [Syntrophales bacterium]
MQTFPEHWEAVSLKDVVSYRKGKKPKVLSNTKTGGTVPYVDIKAFSTGEIRRYADIESSNLTSKNNVLVVWDGARSGLVGIGQEGAIGSTIMALRSIAIDSIYLFRFLQTQYDTINSNPRGTGIPHVDPELFWNIKTPIAPLNEQRRIVAKLGKLLKKVDACKERLDKIPTILKRFRQSILAAACSGRLTEDWRDEHPKARPVETKGETAVSTNCLMEIPQTWRWVNLPKTGEMRRGKSRHRPRNAPFLFGGSYPFIQTGDIAQSGSRITSHKQTYNEAGLAQSRLWPASTVCITIAANIAESALLTYPACFPDSVVGIIADETISLPEFLEFFIRTAKTDLSTFAPATAQKNINIKILGDVLIPLPPLSEQKEIVRRVEALFKIADQIEERYTKARAYVGKLTQSILAKAFRGELVPQDPNDEPASELLKKIKDERNYDEEKSRKIVSAKRNFKKRDKFHVRDK